MSPVTILYRGSDARQASDVRVGLEAEDDDFEVIVADSTSEALTILDSRAIDCLVTDPEIHVESGMAFFEAVTQQHGHIPYLLFNEARTEALVPAAMSTKVTDYVEGTGTTDCYETLAERITHAVGGYTSEQALAREIQRKEALATLGRKALDGTAFEDLCDDAVRLVSSGLDTEFTKVLECVSDEELLLVAGVGWRDTLVGTATVGRDSNSQAGHTLSVSEPVIVEDLRTEQRFGGPPLLTDHDVVSGISVVIGTLEDPWGVLGSHSTERREFTGNDVAFVENVANILGAAKAQAESTAKLRASRERFKTIAAVSPDPIVQIDTDGVVQYVSRASEALLGLQAADAMGRSFETFVTAETRSAAFEGFGRVLEGETVTGLGVTLTAADGSDVDVEVNAAPVRQDGDIVYVQCMLRDVSDRKEREHELVLKERVMDAAPVGITISDPRQRDNPLIYVNDGFERITGYSNEEVIGRNCRFIQGVDTDPEAVATMREAIANAEPVTVELVNYRADGTSFWNRVTIAPVTDADGDVVNFVGFQQDVTARKEQEFELERQIDLFEKAESIANIGVWEHDVTENEQWQTDGVKRIHGLSPDATLDIEESFSHYHPEDRAVIRTAFENALEHNTGYEEELRLIDAQGECRWVRTMGEPQSEDGELVRVRGTLQDISDQKESERELSQFRRAVEQAGTGVFITDADGTIEYVNPAFETLTGYTAAEILGEQPCLLSPDTQTDSSVAEFWTADTNGEVWDGEVINQRQSGEQYTAIQTIAPIHRDGEVTGYVCIQTDITDRLLDQQRLEVFDRLLRHDLRNDLSIIIGHLDILEERADADEMEDSLTAIRGAVEELRREGEKGRELEDLLRSDDRSWSSLTDQLSAIEAAVDCRFETATLAVDIDLPSDVLVPRACERAVLELVENAVIHGDEEVTITVTGADGDDGLLHLTVSDTGPGISPHERTVIENGSEDPLAHSQGVGLWLTYWLVRSVGGTISFEESAVGTTIELTVPQRAMEEPLDN